MRSRTLVKVTDQAVLLTRPITPPPLAQTLFANSHSSRSTRSFLSSSCLFSSSYTNTDSDTNTDATTNTGADTNSNTNTKCQNKHKYLLPLLMLPLLLLLPPFPLQIPLLLCLTWHDHKFWNGRKSRWEAIYSDPCVQDLTHDDKFWKGNRKLRQVRLRFVCTRLGMMTNSEMGEKTGEKQFIQIRVYMTWHMLSVSEQRPLPVLVCGGSNKV